MAPDTVRERIKGAWNPRLLDWLDAEILKRERQLQTAEIALGEVQAKEKAIKDLLRTVEDDELKIVASLEWNATREDLAKLQGKQLKLHRELDSFRQRRQRARRLCNYAQGRHG